MKTKRCSHCKELLGVCEFHTDRQKSDSLRCRCKKCDRLHIDKKRRSIYEKEYWDKRRERKCEIVRKSHNGNIGHHRSVLNEYRKTEEFKRLHRKDSALRRSRMKVAFVEDVDYVEIYKVNNNCVYCGVFLEYGEVHFDHIVPIAKGGLHKNSNIAVSCPSCNKKKGSSLTWVVHNQMV